MISEILIRVHCSDATHGQLDQQWSSSTLDFIYFSSLINGFHIVESTMQYLPHGLSSCWIRQRVAQATRLEIVELEGAAAGAGTAQTYGGFDVRFSSCWIRQRGPQAAGLISWCSRAPTPARGSARPLACIRDNSRRRSTARGSLTMLIVIFRFRIIIHQSGDVPGRFTVRHGSLNEDWMILNPNISFAKSSTANPI